MTMTTRELLHLLKVAEMYDDVVQCNIRVEVVVKDRYNTTCSTDRDRYDTTCSTDRNRYDTTCGTEDRYNNYTATD